MGNIVRINRDGPGDFFGIAQLQNCRRIHGQGVRVFATMCIVAHFLVDSMAIRRAVAGVG